jgi:hypothetical protein
MGSMTFLLPAGLSADRLRDLERACVAGGPDNMPWPTEVRIDPGKLTVRRDVDESGILVVPWEIAGSGRLMGATATLIERAFPYQIQTELARGKVNQLRCQAAEWEAGGLQLSSPLAEEIRATCLAFSRAVTLPTSEGNLEAQNVVAKGYQTSAKLVDAYVQQILEARHQRQPRLDTSLSCSLRGSRLVEDQATAILQAFNQLSFLFTWKEIEPTEGSYCWEAYDALLQWAQIQRLPLTGGPLIDFSAAQLPDWLWLWERDLATLASFMCDYVETTVKRYHKQIRSWQLCTASNCALVLGLGEDELLWLTARLVEAARQVDPKLELSVGVAQPWGEYMAVEDRTHSPYIFADTLIRSGLNLATLDIELVMGVTPRGSYCRDLLEISRLLDLYSLLGLPLRVAIGYPSAATADPRANQEFAVQGGHWHGGFSPDAQAAWASAVASLAISKPSVRAVGWIHLLDAAPHHFPNCGLIDSANRHKPALEKLRDLRDSHLR